MIPAAILHPFYGPHPALMLLPSSPASTVEQPDTATATASTTVAVSEHARLSANTADLWRQLATRLGGMP